MGDRDSKYADDRDASFDADVKSVTNKKRKNAELDEARRNIKWQSFMKTHVAFGFQHLPPAFVPSMSNETRGLAICFEQVTGWCIPAMVLKEFGKGDFELTVQLSLSLYHLRSSSFFGTTWMGPAIQLDSKDGNVPKIIDFGYVDIVYLLSRISDPACVGVVEIVISKFDIRRNMNIAQFGGGWTMLNLFSKPFPPDISDGHENVKPTSCAFYAGSPRDLIINKDITTLAKSLREIPDCSMVYKLYTHRKLIKAKALLAENEAIGRFDSVAGLAVKSVVPSGSTRVKDIPCVSDVGNLDNQNGVLCLPANPALSAGVMILTLLNIQLYIPNRIALEVKMCESFHKGALDTEKVQASVLSRTLRIGIHNGHTVINNDWKSHRLEEDDKDRDILLTMEETVSLAGFVPNELMGLVFTIEYDIGIPAVESHRVDSTNVGKAPPAASVIQYVVGAALYIPSDGRVLLLKNREIDIDDPDGVDIELKVHTDELCALLSPKMIFHFSGTGAGTSGDVAPGTLKKTKSSKARGSDRKSYKAVDASKHEDDRRQPEEEDMTEMMLGFDLRCFSKNKGEMRHEDNIESLVSLEDTGKAAPKLGGQTFEIDEPDFVKDLLAADAKSEKSDAESLRNSKRFTVSPRKGSMRNPYDDDDNYSLVESVVSGKSGDSALRLDPIFYQGGLHRKKGGGTLPTTEAREVAAREEFSDYGDAPHVDAYLNMPRDKNSLLAQSMNARLQTRDRPGAPQDGDLLKERYHEGEGRLKPAPHSIVGINSNASHARELTRGARSLLSRHGFDGALIDSRFDAVGFNSGGEPSGKHGVSFLGDVGASGSNKQRGQNVVVDLELEARDPLSLHEINIQFAGFRAGSKTVTASNNAVELYHDRPPHAVYFSYQFYSCQPTRTEVMRLLPNGDAPGQLCVLARDEAGARNEVPLALRYMIDCSTSSPTEPRDFAEYLAHCALYIDVWDADSLVLLGTCGVPLRALLRQGRTTSKQTIECDIINADLNAQSHGGVTSNIIAENGPVQGTVVGAIQLVLSNYGQRGNGNMRRFQIGSFSRLSEQGEDGLNWRAFGVQHDNEQENRQRAKYVGHRPKNSVRARPLAESSQELNRALGDMRKSGSSGCPRGAGSMRSLTDLRGNETVCTLTYDEVRILFKRFNGAVKGTVQYVGDLMSLLDMPSSQVAIRKLIEGYKKFGDHESFKSEALRHASADDVLTIGDMQDLFRVVFDKSGVGFKPEELALLAQKFASGGIGDNRGEELDDVGGEGGRRRGVGAVGPRVALSRVLDFCKEEATRAEWTMVGSRFRRAVQKALLEGQDVEQMLSDQDHSGSHHVSISGFKEFLRALSKYGKLTPKDMNVCSKFFAKRSDDVEGGKDPISVRDVMAFLGKEYVGNLQVRLRTAVAMVKNDLTPQMVVDRLNKHVTSTAERENKLANDPSLSNAKKGYTFAEVERLLSDLRVFDDLSHDQVNSLMRRLIEQGSKLGGAASPRATASPRAVDRMSLAQVLSLLGVQYKASDLRELITAAEQSGAAAKSPPLSINTDTVGEVVTVEDMLKLLLERVRSNGIAVDEAFRHFDANGDGELTSQEIEMGLARLKIFDHIPNWKQQLPPLLKKFDSSENGTVSLKEFFQYLGIENYAPDIIQRMTKIFAVAKQKGMSLDVMFKELDQDHSGELDADELLASLNAIGTFGEVSMVDAVAVIDRFDSNGDRKISISEFMAFFDERVDQVLRERKRKRGEEVARRFREVMKLAQKSGASAEQIFNHFDKDKGGTVETSELSAGIRQMKHFKGLSDEDIAVLIDTLDTDNSGDVSLGEFVEFCKSDELESSMGSARGGAAAAAEDDRKNMTLLEQLQQVFKRAHAKGLSFEETFAVIDKDGDGTLNLRELEQCLGRMSGFKNVDARELKEIFDGIDTDFSGLISMQEFKDFIVNGKVGVSRAAEQRKKPVDTETTKELFVRHLRRISHIDGGVTGLLAYLDDDEDGLITITALKSIMRREDVFLSLDESEFDNMIQPLLIRRDNISVPALLRFVESKSSLSAGASGSDSSPYLDEDEAQEEAMIVAAKQYVFSDDRETRLLEKKVRGFGKTLAKKGIDVEELFRQYDVKNSGSVRRTELIEVLSKMGMFILEQGKVLDQASNADNDLRRQQIHQINKLKGGRGGNSYLENAPRMARRLLMSDGEPSTDFKDHLESMALINWHRQSQKQQLLQRVLSHSLASTIRIYPRFGKTLFFEFPLTNPFGHEERFVIEINDAELRLVTAFDEWLHLRKVNKPCVGELGAEPVEVEMFDKDARTGTVQVVLLPHETLHIPFTFMTLLPFSPPARSKASRRGGGRRGGKKQASRGSESKHDEADRFSGAYNGEDDDDEDDEGEEPNRQVEVKIISGTHGHVVSILKVNVCPRAFVLNRSLRFFEPENSVMKRRIKLMGHENMSMYPGEFTASSKYIHCVESANSDDGSSSSSGGGVPATSRVVVEWGPTGEHFGGMGTMELLIRYRCSAYPSTGQFYLLVYNDPYCSQLHEVWHVVIQTRLKQDVHTSVGSIGNLDLVVRGDRFPRRCRAFCSPGPLDDVKFHPDNVFQLVPGAYNRVSTQIVPRTMGNRRMQINLVDIDSRELISSWLIVVVAGAPAVIRSYDVDVPLNASKAINKKIIYKNPWDVPRKFKISSSDETAMRPRTENIEVAAHGSTYLRLWFAGSSNPTPKDVMLFINDSTGGQNEECYLFKIKPTSLAANDN